MTKKTTTNAYITRIGVESVTYLSLFFGEEGYLQYNMLRSELASVKAMKFENCLLYEARSVDFDKLDFPLFVYPLFVDAVL